MEQQLGRAYQLAYFILAEPAAAGRVTRDAVAALDVMLARQDKRIYYASGQRTKVSLGEWQMLQQMVYAAAEVEERQQEIAGVATAQLILRYLKHLIYLTTSHNSFFVVLGLSRLFYHYTTAEAAALHTLVVQDPERARDDAYFRRYKARLMDKLQTRFGGRLRVQRGAHGEERFLTMPDARNYAAWIHTCLQAFTPWETHCVLPARFDPYVDELPLLRFDGRHPDAEHAVEMRRLHTLLHPDCFTGLLAALQLAASTDRLAVPQFQTDDAPPTVPPHDGQPSVRQLSEGEMQELKEFVIGERVRRRRFAPTWLSLTVDGVERAHWQLAQTPATQVTLTADDKLLEIYGAAEGDKLRLAAHFLRYDALHQPQPLNAALTLEGGQQVRLHITPVPATETATLTISYRETAPMRIWRMRRQQVRQRWFTMPHRMLWQPVLALLVLSVCSATLWRVLLPSAPTTQTAEAQPTPSELAAAAPASSASPSPLATVAPTARPTVRPTEEVIAMDVRPPAGTANELLTRGEREQINGAQERKKIYLDVSGGGSTGVRRQLLAQRLPFTSQPDEADTALQVVVQAVRGDRVDLTVHLANAEGKVLWPFRNGVSGRRYRGPRAQVIATLARELTRDLGLAR